MSRRPDYILDLSSIPQETPATDASRGGGAMRGRPWIAVRWKCCAAYSRVYRNPAGTAYEGQCPRCGAPVRAAVGPGGTSARFFEAG